ncbi:MAG: hypothetical protein ACK5ML_01255 [Lachnospiraceae bacterium]
MERNRVQNNVRNTRGRSQISSNYYMTGTAANQVELVPEERIRRQKEREEQHRKKINQRAAQRNQEKAKQMNFGYVFFCTIALSLTCLVCVTYIQLQSSIVSNLGAISAMESEISDLKADNDAAIKRIKSMQDLENVKTAATTEYGMQFASSDQIVYYSIDNDDYMDQISDIPEK